MRPEPRAEGEGARLGGGAQGMEGRKCMSGKELSILFRGGFLCGAQVP